MQELLFPQIICKKDLKSFAITVQQANGAFGIRALDSGQSPDCYKNTWDESDAPMWKWSNICDICTSYILNCTLC